MAKQQQGNETYFTLLQWHLTLDIPFANLCTQAEILISKLLLWCSAMCIGKMRL